jgi:hypothetical protein
MAVNFLHANGRNYFNTAAIIVSRKFVSLGRKSCLFVCYEKWIDTELWMVEGVAAFNGGSHSRTVEGKIRRKTLGAMQVGSVFLLFFRQFQDIVSWTNRD